MKNVTKTPKYSRMDRSIRDALSMSDWAVDGRRIGLKNSIYINPAYTVSSWANCGSPETWRIERIDARKRAA